MVFNHNFETQNIVKGANYWELLQDPVQGKRTQQKNNEPFDETIPQSLPPPNTNIGVFSLKTNAATAEESNPTLYSMMGNPDKHFNDNEESIPSKGDTIRTYSENGKMRDAVIRIISQIMVDIGVPGLRTFKGTSQTDRFSARSEQIFRP